MDETMRKRLSCYFINYQFHKVLRILAQSCKKIPTMCTEKPLGPCRVTLFALKTLCMLEKCFAGLDTKVLFRSLLCHDKVACTRFSI